MIILFCLMGIILGSLLVYLLLRPKLNEVRVRNQQIDEENFKIQQENDELKKSNQDLAIIQQTLNKDSDALKEKISVVQQTYDKMSSNADTLASQFYEASMALARNNFEQSAEKERQKYLNTVEQYENEIKKVMEDSTQEFLKLSSSRQQEIETLNNQINELHSSFVSAVAASKRAEEMKEQNDFYKIQLSEYDLEEISRLRDVATTLRNPEALYKVIWKIYYEKPTTDMIGRVVGAGIHCGIYKITDLSNNKCYVGQSVNISDRWKQHIKRGIGAEPATKNKLYPAMLSIGVENFSFEIIEECTKTDLDKREDYWQDFFDAKTYGYSIK